MKTKFLFPVFLLFASVAANAQGQWIGAGGPTFWTYNLGSGIDSKSSSGSAQAYISPGDNFLPDPPNGFVRAGIKENIGGSISFIGGKLTLIASNNGTPHKFSAYSMTDATAVTSYFFTVNFNNTTATNGQLIVGIGNSSASVTTNSNEISGSTQAGLFTYVRFNADATGMLTLYRIKKQDNSGYTTTKAFITGSSNTLSKSGDHAVEIYANNTASTKSYVRSLITYNVPANSFHYWIDGVQLSKNSANTEVDFAATDEGTSGAALDAMIVTTASSTAPSNNALNSTISNIMLGQIPPSVLPVNLVKFTTRSQGNFVNLNWQTSSETNSQYFEVLRSTTIGSGFQSIHKTASKGSPTNGALYSFTDYTASSGINYYQLKQFDKDGSLQGEWTDAATANLDENKLVASVNNDKVLTIFYNAPSACNATINIRDLAGKSVLQSPISLSKGANSSSVSLRTLTKGIYVLTLTGNDLATSIKIKID
jgi:hypothetical protein